MTYSDSVSETSSVWSSDSDQEQTSKYTLGFCDLYHPYYHGEHEKNDDLIETQYLYMMPTNLHNSEQIMSQRIYRLMQRRHIHGSYESEHPHIRNYKSYSTHINHIGPQIIEVVEGPHDYTTAVIKTHYLRLLQRKWKKVVAERKMIIALRKQPKAIMYRRTHGKWPSNCAKYI